MAMICTTATLSGALAANALTEPWSGPYGGVPPFDQVRVADFKPALQTAMAENLAEIDKIAGNPAPASFENTILALELSGQALNRIQAIYHVWSGTVNLGEFPAVQTEMEPKIAAFGDRVVQNQALFARIKAVYQSPENSSVPTLIE